MEDRVAPRPNLSDLPGLVESVLPQALIDTLPLNESPASWTCRCSGLMWLGRANAAASGAFAPALQGNKAVAAVGGFVRYADTPVGPYDEVLGALAVREGRSNWINVAFMAVDSPTSIVGGRENWAMPKTLARFDGSPTRGSSITATSDSGLGWEVSATPRALGPAIPMKSKGITRQQFADGRIGTARLEMKGKMRPALVTVKVRSEGDLGSWLTTGRHLGVFLEDTEFTLGATKFS